MPRQPHSLYDVWLRLGADGGKLEGLPRWLEDCTKALRRPGLRADAESKDGGVMPAGASGKLVPHVRQLVVVSEGEANDMVREWMAASSWADSDGIAASVERAVQPLGGRQRAARAVVEYYFRERRGAHGLFGALCKVAGDAASQCHRPAWEALRHLRRAGVPQQLVRRTLQALTDTAVSRCERLWLLEASYLYCWCVGRCGHDLSAEERPCWSDLFEYYLRQWPSPWMVEGDVRASAVSVCWFIETLGVGESVIAADQNGVQSNQAPPPRRWQEAELQALAHRLHRQAGESAALIDGDGSRSDALQDVLYLVALLATVRCSRRDGGRDPASEHLSFTSATFLAAMRALQWLATEALADTLAVQASSIELRSERLRTTLGNALDVILEAYRFPVMSAVTDSPVRAAWEHAVRATAALLRDNATLSEIFWRAVWETQKHRDRRMAHEAPHGLGGLGQVAAQVLPHSAWAFWTLVEAAVNRTEDVGTAARWLQEGCLTYAEPVEFREHLRPIGGRGHDADGYLVQLVEAEAELALPAVPTGVRVPRGGRALLYEEYGVLVWKVRWNAVDAAPHSTHGLWALARMLAWGTDGSASAVARDPTSAMTSVALRAVPPVLARMGDGVAAADVHTGASAGVEVAASAVAAHLSLRITASEWNAHLAGPVRTALRCCTQRPGMPPEKTRAVLRWLLCAWAHRPAGADVGVDVAVAPSEWLAPEHLYADATWREAVFSALARRAHDDARGAELGSLLEAARCSILDAERHPSLQHVGNGMEASEAHIRALLPSAATLTFSATASTSTPDTDLRALLTTLVWLGGVACKQWTQRRASGSIVGDGSARPLTELCADANVTRALLRLSLAEHGATAEGIARREGALSLPIRLTRLPYRTAVAWLASHVLVCVSALHPTRGLGDRHLWDAHAPSSPWPVPMSESIAGHTAAAVAGGATAPLIWLSSDAVPTETLLAAESAAGATDPKRGDLFGGGLLSAIADAAIPSASGEGGATPSWRSLLAMIALRNALPEVSLVERVHLAERLSTAAWPSAGERLARWTDASGTEAAHWAVTLMCVLEVMAGTDVGDDEAAAALRERMRQLEERAFGAIFKCVGVSLAKTAGAAADSTTTTTTECRMRWPAHLSRDEREDAAGDSALIDRVLADLSTESLTLWAANALRGESVGHAEGAVRGRLRFGDAALLLAQVALAIGLRYALWRALSGNTHIDVSVSTLVQLLRRLLSILREQETSTVAAALVWSETLVDVGWHLQRRSRREALPAAAASQLVECCCAQIASVMAVHSTAVEAAPAAAALLVVERLLSVLAYVLRLGTASDVAATTAVRTAIAVLRWQPTHPTVFESVCTVVQSVRATVTLAQHADATELVPLLYQVHEVVARRARRASLALANALLALSVASTESAVQVAQRGLTMLSVTPPPPPPPAAANERSESPSAYSAAEHALWVAKVRLYAVLLATTAAATGAPMRARPEVRRRLQREVYAFVAGLGGMPAWPTLRSPITSAQPAVKAKGAADVLGPRHLSPIALEAFQAQCLLAEALTRPTDDVGAEVMWDALEENLSPLFVSQLARCAAESLSAALRMVRAHHLPRSPVEPPQQEWNGDAVPRRQPPALPTLYSSMACLLKVAVALSPRYPVFAPSMSVARDTPSLGTLLGIVAHVATERPPLRALLVETSLTALTQHVWTYIEREEMSVGVLHECLNRLSVIANRLEDGGDDPCEGDAEGTRHFCRAVLQFLERQRAQMAAEQTVAPRRAFSAESRPG